MKYIDLHCDTLLKVFNKDESLLRSNDIASVDFNRMKKGDALAQFFAIFLLTDEIFDYLNIDKIKDDEYIDKLINYLKNSVSKNNDIIEMAYNYKDLMKNEKNNKMSAFITIEDGRSVGGKLDKIKTYYDKGVRLISLTWNHENCFGYPNSKDSDIMKKGLKEFGIEAIRYMNDLGIIVDVSHLSDGGFYDVVKYSNKPFVASHSNSRLLSPHTRNLTDDMIKKLADSGGVAGLNFGPEFLDKETTDAKDSTVELMVKHLEHMRDIGGSDVIGLGSDFDGIHGNLEIDGSDKMLFLFDALKKQGWSESLIEKVAYKNALRVIKESMK